MASLKIAEHTGQSDVGRQRHTNEDAFLASPPLFAVADGMGGAQAGEIASGLAVETLGDERDESTPREGQLEALARAANRRIYDMAQRDESRRGMGTTLTVAWVGDNDLAIAHVGDSRAYRMRDDTLEQLTYDHSLVAELERTGQLTADEAEHHPQKSIITRALGPEPDVEVDTHTHATRPGDVYLLCSDGLTTMLSDDEVARIVRGGSALEETAAALILAANQSGGKDNITVVLFRLGEGGETATADAPPVDEESTIAGQLKAEDLEAAAAAEAVSTPSEAEPPAPDLEPLPPEPQRAAQPARPRRRRARRLVVGLLALAVLGGVAFGLYSAARGVYFVGTNDAGLVTLYRGVPYELPFGVDLYEEEYASGVPARAIPRSRRGRVLDHEWRGHDDAVDLVRALEQGRLEE